MAGTKTSDEDPAGALTGAEVLRIVQGGANKQTTLSDILAHFQTTFDTLYAAASHTHAIADITSLQTTLDGKASTTHDHDADYLGISAKAADSELLDGLNSTDFARTTARSALNSATTGASGIATGTANLGEIEVRASSGGAAMMAFHRPGAYASYFGLDSDNVWKVGGWSAGANSYKIWHEGTMPLGTLGILQTGTDTSYRAWSADVLDDRMNEWHVYSLSLVLATVAGTTAGAVGAYGFMKNKTVVAGLNPGDVIAGSGLHYTSHSAYDTFAASGSWRCMGHCTQNSASVFLRYA